MNNDGNDACGYGLPPAQVVAAIAAGPEALAEAFWSQRCDGLEESQIDAVFYCTTYGFNLHTHDSQVAELFTEGYDLANQTTLNDALIRQGRDCLQLTIDYCRQHSREVFWSQRMNDIHDNWFPSLMSRFKAAHPELLLFQADDVGRVRSSPDHVEPHMVATAVDYGQAAIRDCQFAIIEDVCRRYDVDGVELDFLRNPIYFRPTLEGRPAAQEHVAAMTDFMRRLREVAEQVGRERDRPFLIACLIPNRVRACLAIGLDIETWLERDLIDVITSSLERDQFTGPIHEMVKLGHRHEAPVYTCLSETGPSFQGIDRIDGWCGAAAHAYHAGVDGIYTYNHFDPRSPVFQTVGDATALTKMDKVFAVDNLAGTIRTWESAFSRQGRLPMELSLDAECRVTLPVADDVARAELSMRIRIDRMSIADEIEFKLNGHPLETEIISISEGVSPAARSRCLLKAKPDPVTVLQGDNDISAHLKRRSECAPGMPAMAGLQLVVRYKH